MERRRAVTRPHTAPDRVDVRAIWRAIVDRESVPVLRRGDRRLWLEAVDVYRVRFAAIYRLNLLVISEHVTGRRVDIPDNGQQLSGTSRPAPHRVLPEVVRA